MTLINEIQIVLQNKLKRTVPQAEIAEALGTSRANISMRIKNKSILQITEIQKLEEYFNIKLINMPDDIEEYKTHFLNPFYIKSMQILNAAQEAELEYYYGLLLQGQRGINILKSSLLRACFSSGGDEGEGKES